MPNLLHLPCRDDEGTLRAVVEAPRGSPAKIRYNPDEQIFEFGRPLCLGIVYPYDWGFVPGTRAEDGDPLDVLIYHDMASYPGVVLAVNPIGVVRAVQKDPGEKWERNDRLIAVPAHEKRITDATDLEKRVRRELEAFFELNTTMTGKKIRIEGWEGPRPANETVERAAKAYERGKLKK